MPVPVRPTTVPPIVNGPVAPPPVPPPEPLPEPLPLPLPEPLPLPPLMPLQPLMRSAAIPSRAIAKFFLAIVFNLFILLLVGVRDPHFNPLSYQVVTPARALDSHPCFRPNSLATAPPPQSQTLSRGLPGIRSTQPVSLLSFL